MDLQLTDRVIVVTGGTSGIGLATVRLLLQEGARVAFCGRSEDRLNHVSDALADDFASDRFACIACDVLNADAVDGFSRAVTERFGRVDGLVNNAGQRRMTTFASTTDDDWNEELSLKLYSIVRPTRAFAELLKQAERPAIVCVNSLLALQPEPHLVATSAARAAVLNLTRSMATEFVADGIRVNSILLGTVNSGQWRRQYEQLDAPKESFDQWLAGMAKCKNIPLGRFGEPEEAARAIAFLVSPASAYTTGSAIDVSGGMRRHI